MTTGKKHSSTPSIKVKVFCYWTEVQVDGHPAVRGRSQCSRLIKLGEALKKTARTMLLALSQPKLKFLLTYWDERTGDGRPLSPKLIKLVQMNTIICNLFVLATDKYVCLVRKFHYHKYLLCAVVFVQIIYIKDKCLLQ